MFNIHCTFPHPSFDKGDRSKHTNHSFITLYANIHKFKRSCQWAVIGYFLISLDLATVGCIVNVSSVNGMRSVSFRCVQLNSYHRKVQCWYSCFPVDTLWISRCDALINSCILFIKISYKHGQNCWDILPNFQYSGYHITTLNCFQPPSPCQCCYIIVKTKTGELQTPRNNPLVSQDIREKCVIFLCHNYFCPWL